LIWSDENPIGNPVAENSPAPRYHLISIPISKKLPPVDQLLALSFETCNAQGLPEFDALLAQAAAGKITREDFVDRNEETEYRAILRMKKSFPKLLAVSSNEVTFAYRTLLEIPVGFQEYQAWSVRIQSEDYIRAHDLYARSYDDIAKRK
jgi:hypothetical protein